MLYFIIDYAYHGPKARIECQKTLYSNPEAALQNTHTQRSRNITPAAKCAWDQLAMERNFLEDMLKAKYECDREIFKYVSQLMCLSATDSQIGLGTLSKELLAASQAFPTRWWFRQ